MEWVQIRAELEAKKMFGSFYIHEIGELWVRIKEIESQYPDVSTHRYPAWLKAQI